MSKPTKKLAWCVAIGGRLMPSYTRTRRNDSQEAVEKDMKKSWGTLAKENGAKMVQVEVSPVAELSEHKVHPVVKICAQVFKVEPEDIFSFQHNQRVAEARFACYLILADKGMGYRESAVTMNRQEPSAALKAILKGKELIHQQNRPFIKAVKRAMELCVNIPTLTPTN